jgi:hypothetical protein
MKKGLELTTSWDIKLGIPQPQQNIYNNKLSIYIICIVDDIIFVEYTSIFEYPSFLLGLLGFAGVVSKYDTPQDQRKDRDQDVDSLTTGRRKSDKVGGLGEVEVK